MTHTVDTAHRQVAPIRQAVAGPGETPEGTPIGRWLQSIGMSRHTMAFEEQRVEFSHLPGLTDADLQNMGITAVGDRKTILAGIAGLAEKKVSEADSQIAVRAREYARSFDRGCFRAAMILVAGCAVLGIFVGGVQSMWEGIVIAVVGSIALYLYSLPAVLAFRKRHPRRWAILIANWLLGATGVVWIILFCYAIGLIGSGAAVALGYFARQD